MYIRQHLLVQLHSQKEAPPAKVELQSGIGLTISAINIGYKLSMSIAIYDIKIKQLKLSVNIDINIWSIKRMISVCPRSSLSNGQQFTCADF